MLSKRGLDPGTLGNVKNNTVLNTCREKKVTIYAEYGSDSHGLLSIQRSSQKFVLVVAYDYQGGGGEPISMHALYLQL